MQRFLVVYLAPIAGMEEWMKTAPLVRKEAEDKMKAEWNEWMQAHKALFVGETAGVGKTKRITKGGITDVKNDMMLYSVIEAESHDAAAEAFKDHPHFGIPGASIEIMPANFLPSVA